MAQDKIEQKTRAATERVAMGLDRFTKKMLSENQYMTREVMNNSFFIHLFVSFRHWQIYLRRQELAQLEQQVRALEETNLSINEKLNAAHLTDATAFTYGRKLLKNKVQRLLFSLFIGIHS